ncbi:MAG TPA: hypothetical protein VM533_13040 [Fimbriiglobus sp.]|jgi:hypothetical protein|nr:hypothetical protein [Fimbriiglobus sp.]
MTGPNTTTRRLAAGIILAALAASATGCGSGSTAAPGNVSGSTVAPAGKGTPQPGPKTRIPK